MTAIMLIFALAGAGNTAGPATLEFAEQLHNQGRYAEAIDQYRQCSHDPNPLTRIKALNGRAVAELELGDLKAAERTLATVLALVKAMDPPDPTSLSVVENNLGALYIRRGQPYQAEPILRRAYSTLNRIHGPGELITVSARDNLALALQLERKLDQARVLFEESLAAARAVPLSPADIAGTLHRLGELNLDLGQLAKAESCLTEADLLLPAGQPGRPKLELSLGRLFKAQHRWEESARALLAAASGFARSAGVGSTFYATVALEYLSLPRAFVDRKGLRLTKEQAIRTLVAQRRDDGFGVTVDYQQFSGAAHQR